jgi:hypothetical protein
MPAVLEASFVTITGPHDAAEDERGGVVWSVGIGQGVAHAKGRLPEGADGS